MTLKSLVGTVLAFALSPTIARAAPPASPARPNIVILLADDMGFSDIGCYGGEIRTPNIDSLAASGVRFTQFYNAGRCCPTRASLLTGLYPHQADVGWMTSKSADIPGYRDELSRNALTIAEVLRPAGYSTYMTGKWHVSRDDLPTGPQPNWPRQRGFDRFYGTNKGGAGYFDPVNLVRDDTPITPASDPEYHPQSYYVTDAIADQAARYIREHPQQPAKPFFLYVAFTAPHWPLHAPAAAVERYRGVYDAGYEPTRLKRLQRQKQLGILPADAELSPLAGDWDKVANKAWEARCMEVYAAQVELLDAGVGRVVQALRDTHQLDHTLLLFLSDNGGCAEKIGREAHPATKPARPLTTTDGRTIHDGPDTLPGPDDTFLAYGRNWANVSNTPFREYKHYVHEGGTSTPFIAHWPDGISRPGGSIERQPAHIIDLLPTFLALASRHYPDQIHGQPATPLPGTSLLPAIAGQPLDRKTPLFWEHEGNRAIRLGQWKLVAKGAAGPWELYDIDADRAELHNLAGQHPDRVSDLADQWQHWAQTTHVLPLNPFNIPQAAD